MTIQEMQELYDRIVCLDIDDDIWTKTWFYRAKKLNAFIELQQDYQRSLV